MFEDGDKIMIKFLNDYIDGLKNKDEVFNTLLTYNNDDNPNKINSTIGSLFDENHQLIAYKSVYDSFRNLSNQAYAKYPASLKGNREFLDAIYNFVTDNHIHLAHKEIATIGGTGALSIAMMNYLNKGETIIIPDIAWSAYKLMANTFNLKTIEYEMFNIDDLLKKITVVAKKQGKVVILINDPAQNPTGCSMSKDEWIKIIDKLNNLNQNIPIVIINDIAYIDYCFDEHAKDYFDEFNRLNENITLHLAYSLSKSFTFYGQRGGAAIICNKNPQHVENIINAFEKSLRSTTSCANNALMLTFTDVYNHKLPHYQQELNEAKNILKMRVEKFITQARSVNLELYPYSDGFFITIKLSDNEIVNKVHQELMKQHIYVVKVNKGLRVAICSISLSELDNLALNIKKIITKILSL